MISNSKGKYLRKGKVLFLDKAHPSLMDELENLGYSCHYDPAITPGKLISILPELSGLIVRSKFRLDKNILQHADKLQFIGRVGSGLENIDVDYARSKGIVCMNSPEGNRDAVGEYALGLLLALINNLVIADREVRQGTWEREKNRGVEIKGKTVAIIGYGNTGSAFAQRLQGFEAKIIAFDKHKKNYPPAFVKEGSLEEVYEHADIVSFHVPLNPETRYMCDRQFFERFQKNILLVNTARGGILNTSDLVAALKSGKVQGAALDVLEYEHLSFEKLEKKDLPPPFQYLASSKNVVLSPHIAGWTHESYIKLSTVLAEKIKALR